MVNRLPQQAHPVRLVAAIRPRRMTMSSNGSGTCRLNRAADIVHRVAGQNTLRAAGRELRWQRTIIGIGLGPIAACCSVR
jgi:hypothetical protein